MKVNTNKQIVSFQEGLWQGWTTDNLLIFEQDGQILNIEVLTDQKKFSKLNLTAKN
jgi:hypothetical protein